MLSRDVHSILQGQDHPGRHDDVEDIQTTAFKKEKERERTHLIEKRI